MPSLSVLIIGCGNIAGGFDLGRPSGFLPLTHAGAFRADGRFCLAACVEPDDQKRHEFMAAWGVGLGFRSMAEVLASGKTFDVISICTPTDNHAFDLETALIMQPKLVFCEKPLTVSIAASKRLVESYKMANILLMVNYSRRWDTDVLKLAVDMNSGSLGQLQAVVGYYNKGILNNGSHMLDVLHLLIGSMTIVKVGKPIIDYFDHDPSIPVWLEGSKGLPIMLAVGHAKDFALFELQLVFAQGVITMEEGGLSWRERLAKDSETFKGYRMLDEGVFRVGQYPSAMLNAIDNIYRSIKSGDFLPSTGETALIAQRLCEQIKLESGNIYES